MQTTALVKPSKMTARVELVTPEAAAKLLRRNRKNRPLTRESWRRIRRLAQKIRDGRWVNNGASVVFRADGELIDGQHRLHAIIESGIGVPLVIVDGASNEPEAFTEMVNQKPRSEGDTLVVLGKVSGACKHPDDVSYAAKWYLWGKSDMTSAPQQFIHQLGKSYDLDDVPWKLLERGDNTIHLSPCASKITQPRGLFIALYTLFREQWGAPIAEAFFEELGGAGNGKRCKVRKLYDYLLSTQERKINDQCVKIMKMSVAACEQVAKRRSH